MDVSTLLADPAAYNRKLIEVSGIVSHGFENFSLSDPGCVEPLGVWLEYGGTADSGTVYCCGAIASRTREAPLMVDGIRVPLNRDATFRRFDARIQRDGDVSFRATLIGAWRASRDAVSGRPMLAAAWGFACGLGYASFFSQLVERGTDPSGLASSTMVIIKGCMLAVGIAALIATVRSKSAAVSGGSPEITG